MGEENPSSKLSEILRPGLVAGKLLRRRRLVSGEDACHETCTQSETVKYRVFAGTWNVAGVEPPDDLDLDDWLDTDANSYDIYVLGLQEIVPLNARNVLGPTRSSPATKWNSLIGDALNRSSSSSTAALFSCVASEQMVGIFVTVWARRSLRRQLRHAAACRVGAGVLGRLGNKGGVSVRFMLHGTSFCFVCCHLASGGDAGDRNADAADILSRTTFPCEENDELLLELGKGGSFDGWREGHVTFAPTYKYHLNSDCFYGCEKKEQQRAPAWCDRILWRGKGLRQERYERCGSYRMSDHRPVRAVFHAVCESLPLASN
uniref:Inositol polyphosphate-related phosphatase domain-containing protein n=1 Tax=Leersia perrieri TaxID=77586 RepID=A0A0D9X800_9ORYZ